jgi:XRE family transcriptional regulator, fatty acid utilization regulator
VGPISRVAMRIRVLRLERGLTQARLAEQASISREHLARLEAGRHDPRLSVLERIAAALKVSAAELLK